MTPNVRKKLVLKILSFCTRLTETTLCHPHGEMINNQSFSAACCSVTFDSDYTNTV